MPELVWCVGIILHHGFQTIYRVAFFHPKVHLGNTMVQLLLFNGNKFATSITYFPKLDLIFLLLNAQGNYQRSLEHLISVEIVHRLKFK